MPFKPSPGSAFRCDIRFPLPVGRIAKSLGTTDKREFAQRCALLRDLYSTGQHRVLIAFRDGYFDIAQLLAVKRERRLTDDGIEHELTVRRPLWATLDEAIVRSPGNGHTKQSYQSSAKKLAKAGVLPQDATIRDLVDVDWAGLRRSWGASASSWNAMRRMLSMALAIALGDKHHPHRVAVMKRIPIAAEAKFRAGHIDLPIFLDIVARMPPYAQAAAWVLVLTGLRSGTEYMRLTPEHLDHNGYFVTVPATKTESSLARVYVAPEYWPWVVAGTPAPLGHPCLYTLFKRAAREAGHPLLTLHHLRNLHGILPLNRGASVSDVQSSMRHSSPTMTLRYTVQQGRGRVAGIIGDALAEAGAEPAAVMPGPLAAVVAEAAHTARLTLVAEVTDAPRRPGRPKGAVYPADLECIRRRQARRLAAQEQRLRHHLTPALARGSTITPTTETARSPRIRERAD